MGKKYRDVYLDTKIQDVLRRKARAGLNIARAPQAEQGGRFGEGMGVATLRYSGIFRRCYLGVGT